MTLPRGVRRALTALFVLAAFGFLAWTAARNWQELQRFDWQVDATQLALATLALTLVLGFGIWVWRRVLLRFGRAVPFAELLRIWFLSSIARYIPGKIWQFVAVGQLAGRAGLSGVVMLTSMVVQMGFVILAAAVVGTATLPLKRLGLGVLGGWAPVVALLVALLLVHPAVINFWLGLVPKALHKDVLVWEGRWRDGVGLLLLNVVSWLLYGVVFALFVDALVDVSWGLVLPLAGVNALAFVAGYLVFIAPAGLGVREAAMALLLAPFAPAGVASLIAILSRLWTIAAELVGAGGSVLLARRGSRANG